MRRDILLLGPALCWASCTYNTNLYCDEDTPCTLPDRPFCDLNGDFPESEGHGRTCIPTPQTPDAGASIDARIRAFDEHESAFSCVGDPNTAMLLHFDVAPFVDDCVNGIVTSIPTSVVEPQVKFQGGARINLPPTSTTFVDIDPGLTANYTVDAWIQPEGLPGPGETMVIASMVKPLADLTTIEDAAWRLGVTSDGELRLDLFADSDTCNAVHAMSPFVTGPLIPTGVLTHVRASVSPSQINLYINGFLEVSTDIFGAAPCDSTTAHLRIGGVDRGADATAEMVNFPAFVGYIDEVRFSTIAR